MTVKTAREYSYLKKDSQIGNEMTKSVIISKLHKGQRTRRKSFESEEGQRELLCSNKGSTRCPSLAYEYVESQESLDKAFDILFEEVLRCEQKQENNGINKIDSDLHQSFSSQG